ncbi:MAG: potassium channel family protein [Candidatus Hadarchaeales archaeon]
MKKANYVIIAGGGRIGAHLAKVLEPSGRDIVIIEKNPKVCEKLSSELSAMIICGDATDIKILEEAKIQEADVFAGVTGNDNENIVACQLAKFTYKVPLVLARVEDVERAEMLKNMGIDLIVNPSHVAAMVFENAIALPGTTSILVSETVTRAVEIVVPEAAKVVGKRIRDLNFPIDCVIASIYRAGKLIIPHGDTVIKPGDILAVIGKEEAIAKVVKLLES